MPAPDFAPRVRRNSATVPESVSRRLAPLFAEHVVWAFFIGHVFAPFLLQTQTSAELPYFIVRAWPVLEIVFCVIKVSYNVIVRPEPMLEIVERIRKGLHDLVVLPELRASEQNFQYPSRPMGTPQRRVMPP
ncbi:hypothetical protein IVB38_38560 [Bradyrhizobium sp. 38]|uniref:hypothetical protein n=1 Tax=unclassified Bradyrhizobium TaxID=2631580 RepID=UPI001FFB3B1C|nr:MULTISPECIES: hypothetical protein [unclassified Bradyrhizobium]MCK1341720.1 hypothetical protein [Bradyrhizobium sp. 38]MCK1346104.1 hypothetical protein [Bradyrhizobium sp. CW11]MCK1410040.1 hypothetical protein [Bradyrhizobium sp. 76]MCK1779762.1 hypothetical protein [Bradyrhizobium sp. 132]